MVINPATGCNLYFDIYKNDYFRFCSNRYVFILLFFISLSHATRSTSEKKLISSLIMTVDYRPKYHLLARSDNTLAGVL